MKDRFVLALAAPLWGEGGQRGKTIWLNRTDQERIALDPICFEQKKNVQLDIELFIGATQSEFRDPDFVLSGGRKSV